MKQPYGVIYCFFCTISHKMYIGKSTDPEGRRKAHFGEAYAGSNRHFCSAIRKYSKNAFIWKIIDEAFSEEELNILEKFYIALLDTKTHSYNMTDGGEGISGYQHTDKFKKWQSDQKKGQIVMIKNGHRTYIRIDEHDKYLALGWTDGNGMKGSHHTQETK